MAEILRTQTTVGLQTLLMGELSGPEQRTTETTVVRSIRAGVIDVSVLRNLVEALDEAAVPGTAFVTGERSQEGHLIQLTVRHEVDIVESETCGGGC